MTPSAAVRSARKTAEDGKFVETKYKRKGCTKEWKERAEAPTPKAEEAA